MKQMAESIIKKSFEHPSRSPENKGATPNIRFKLTGVTQTLILPLFPCVFACFPTKYEEMKCAAILAETQTLVIIILFTNWFLILTVTSLLQYKYNKT